MTGRLEYLARTRDVADRAWERFLRDEADPLTDATLLHDRVRELEDTLRQAHHTISFLHGCLTDAVYQYAYPEMTLQELTVIDAALPLRGPSCAHSVHNDGCDGCLARRARFTERAARYQRMTG